VPKPLWQARDGLINFGLGDFRNWTESMKVMGLDDFAHDEDLIEDIGRHGNPKIADVSAAAAGSILDKDRAELFHDLSKLRSICGMVRDMSDVYNCEHLDDRDYFVETEIEGKKVKLPGPPAKLSSLKWSLSSNAPTLNEHNDSVDMDRDIQIDSLNDNGAVSADGPLAGTRVLTFAHAWSGPFATQLLGFLGAEVVQIEAPHRPDVWRRTGKTEIMEGVKNDSIPQHPLNTQGLYNSTNLNKRAITLNMGTEEGQDIFWDLVPNFDVVVDNFTPNVMSRWGVTQETLEEKNPSMIYASLSAFGATGPYQEYPGNGGTTEPMSGLSSIHGYEGDMGMNTGGMIPDPISGFFIVSCIIAAINNRDRTGQGQRIEGSMIEAMTMVVGDPLGKYQMSGIIPRPTGNQHPVYAPHNVYKTSNGEWVAVAIETEESWEAFSGFLGLSSDSRFSDANKRKNNEEILDEIVAKWIGAHLADDAERIITQIHGCAAKVLSPYEMYTKPDKNFLSRGFISNIEHPETGVNILPTRWWKFGSGISSEVFHAPCFGEHSQEILNEFLDIKDEEYQLLVEKLVTGTIYDYERYK
jgi:crotonobetainyl-CoA:carnitine CoA-transferase CaiB-like acyl-CoA transferase